MPQQRARKEVPSHPYREYEGTPLWRALNKGIADLVENQDLEERTRREYIVGYLCKLLARRKKGLFSS
jgi:hypothetical protein